MVVSSRPPSAVPEVQTTGWMLPVLTGAAFVIFAQAFMIAPVLPRLADVFEVDIDLVGLAVPAYLIPYGIMTLLWGPLADRVGARPVVLGSLALFVAFTAATATAPSGRTFVLWRAATGAGASGVIPISLALIGDLIPYRQRGRAIGWLFGGMAGGMAVGSTVGALAEPTVGWRGLFVAAAIAGAVLLGGAATHVPKTPRPADAAPLGAIVGRYRDLLGNSRARRTYAYVAFNAVVHSGVYTWLGLYLQERFDLGPVGIGLALMGYGIPGFLLGPVIGRVADRHGRSRLVPAGVAFAACATFGLALPVPLVAAVLLVTLLSLGYDLTQPLLAGIVTDLSAHRGQAIAFMAVALFSGFGAGSLLFQAALTQGFTVALSVFGVVTLLAAALAVPTFADERPAGSA